MKKIFLFFALFLSFIFIDNVYAYSTSPDSSYRGYYDFTNIYEQIGNSSSFDSNYNDFINWFNSQSTYTSYYYLLNYRSSSTFSTPEVWIILFDSYSESQEFFLNFRYYNSYIQFRYETNNPPTYYYYNVFSNSSSFDSSNIHYTSCLSSNICFSSDSKIETPSGSSITLDYYPFLLYDSNVPLYLGNWNTSTAYEIKLGDYYYHKEDILPSIKDFTSPSISLATNRLFDSSNNLVGYDVYVNWHLKDLDNFIYRYKESSSDWTYVETSSIRDIFHIFLNGSYTFQILDKSDNSIVSTYNLTLTNIYEGNPFINYKVSYMCETNYMGTIYNPCIAYKFDVDNFDPDTMRLEYSTDNTNWTTINPIHSVPFYQNGTYYVRVYNRLSDVSLADISINVSSITIPNTQDPYITYNVSCDETVFLLVYYNAFNVQSDYSYQYITSMSDSFSYINNVNYDSSNHIASFYVRSIVDSNEITVRVINDLNDIVLVSSNNFNDLMCVNGNVVQGESIPGEIDNTFDFVNSGYSNFIAQCLRIVYDNCPSIVLDYIVKFLILFCLGTFLVVLGWK